MIQKPPIMSHNPTPAIFRDEDSEKHKEETNELKLQIEKLTEEYKKSKCDMEISKKKMQAKEKQMKQRENELNTKEAEQKEMSEQNILLKAYVGKLETAHKDIEKQNQLLKLQLLSTHDTNGQENQPQKSRHHTDYTAPPNGATTDQMTT